MSCLFGISAVLVTNDDFLSAMSRYGTSGDVVYLHRVPDEKVAEVSSLMMKTADEHSSMIIRGDSLVKPDGSAGGYKFGFYGNPSDHETGLKLKFLGSEVFGEANISELLKSGPDATLGLDSVKANQIATLPSIWAGNKVVGVKLKDLIEQSGTINGAYRFVDLPHNDYEKLIANLSKTLDVPEDRISNSSSGVYAHDSLMRIIVHVAIGATWLTILFLSIVGAYQSMGVMGTHLLLGWSKTGYAIKVFYKLALSSLVGILVSAAIFMWSIQDISYNSSFILRAMLSGTPAIALTLVAIFLASLSLLRIDPVAAIRRRISVKALAAFLAVFYLVANCSVVAGMKAVDGPLHKVAELKQVQQRWEEYSDLAILYKEKVGQNVSSVSGQASEHAKEYHEWYKSIQKKDGVFLVNTTYISDETLDIWRNGNIYADTPEEPFWEMVASPSYLAKYGLPVDANLVEKAYRGTRLYLIPSTMAPSARKHLESYLTDYSLKDRESSIKTLFSQEKQVIFSTYNPTKELFLWNDNPSLPDVAKDPVILVSTAENMIPIESESLWATGITNSYIKLDKEAAAQYLAPSYLAAYNLDDNAPKFLPVSDFIAGLTKSLTETIELFGSAIALLLVLTAIAFVGLVRIYSTMRHEEIAVKQLLGYRLSLIFLQPMLLVVITSFICVTAAFGLGSVSGVIVVLFFMFVQLALLLHQARIASRTSIATLIKTA